MTYDKVTIGFVIQKYVDGQCVEQEFIAGDEVTREDAHCNAVEVDAKTEQYQEINLIQPVPVEIESVIRDGELDIDPEKSVADALDQCSRLMDKGCTWDVLGSPLFRDKNGRFYTIELCAEVLPASLKYIEEEINNLLADYRGQSEDASDTVGVDAELTKIALIKDDKERVGAKMDLYNRLSGLKGRLDAVKERVKDEQQP